MKVGSDHRLLLEAEENVKFRFERSPNYRYSVNPISLIIHATEGRNVQAVVDWFKIADVSAHLIIAKDGAEIVQMVDFNRGAFHAGAYNTRSLGIELDYPGFLVESEHPFRALNFYNENDYIWAVAENDFRLRPWPVYPQAQVDTLLQVSRTLVDQYDIREVLGHEEINEGKRDPGPAFPMTKFRESLYGLQSSPLVLEEVSRETLLRTGPGTEYPPLVATPLAAGTPISVIGDQYKWVLVEVVTEVEGNPWVVGWLDAEAIKARRFVPVVHENHLLYTQEGRHYKVIPAHPENYAPKRKINEHKYVVMHFTTGTNMQNTINHFRNPDASVSAHLLVGRDGRVVQFVPFDTVAYHCGYSYWEGDEDLNQYSIGIELDNAGILVPQNIDESTVIYRRKTTIIDSDEVAHDTHWKEAEPRDWQEFTPIQLEVALDIVKTLKQHYQVKEILGHDMINLQNRLDPGPRFPMEFWRQKLFARRQPEMVLYETTQETDIYTNLEGQVPNLNYPRYKENLPDLSTVKILDVQGTWALVTVKAAEHDIHKNRTGWIESAFIRHNGMNYKTTASLAFYKRRSGDPLPLPPRLLPGGPLPANTPIRIQVSKDSWALIAILNELRYRFVEGWIKSEFIRPAPHD